LITQRFETLADEFLGGQEDLEFGKGIWLEMIKGKPVLHTVVNRCFEIKDQRRRLLQGPERLVQIAKNLVRKPLTEQPQDFQQLHYLIHKRVKK
jgi:hypothetical protein